MKATEAAWQVPTHQRVYRALLAATASPGSVHDVGPGALTAVLATLCDATTSLADPSSLLPLRDRALLRAGQAGPESADFVLCDGGCAPEAFTPALGELESPERGATLLVTAARIGRGPLKLVIEGPGVNGQAALAVNGVHPRWFERRADWVADFPVGVDFVLCDDERIAALPRTARVRLEV